MLFLKTPIKKALQTLYFFRYDSIVNGEHRFIEFRENEMIWGNETLTFTHSYSTDRGSDELRPHLNQKGYDINFSQNYIIYNWHNSEHYKECSELYQSSNVFSIFNLKNNLIQYPTYIHSINLSHELFVIQQEPYLYDDNLYKHPLVIANFDRTHCQFIEIEIDEHQPSPIIDIHWLSDTLLITYEDEYCKFKVDTTIIDKKLNINPELGEY